MSEMLGTKVKRMESGSHWIHCPACDMPHPIGVEKPLANGAQWHWDGNVEKPTYSPSISVKFPYKDNPQHCHSFVVEGKWRFLDDCTHHLKGQIVDMVDIPLDDLE